MNMNKITIREINNLCTMVFEDKEYKKMAHYIASKQYNNARLLAEERLEYLETTLVLHDKSDVIELEIKNCKKLEDILTNEYINSLTAV